MYSTVHVSLVFIFIFMRGMQKVNLSSMSEPGGGMGGGGGGLIGTSSIHVSGVDGE